jgi:peptidoglycan/LPS O-acetylase OafA/YrhL
MQCADLKHRPDVDGLRALAVMLVLAFHLEVPHLRGGFVGVDVFFVISGYLITSIIVKDIRASRFSIPAFYERRARRILPALVVVMLTCTCLTLHYLFPSELVAYARSMLAATFSYSNIYFWYTAGYFDAPAQAKPLLHTWSLAVEEQFYLVLPMLLLLISTRWPRRRNAVVVALAACSFLWSVWSAYKLPIDAFYLPLSRAWELLAGSILALDLLPPITVAWAREIAALVGISFIGCAATYYSGQTPFPGLAGVLPCVGALLVLAAGRYGSSTNRTTTLVAARCFCRAHFLFGIFVALAADYFHEDGLFAFATAETSSLCVKHSRTIPDNRGAVVAAC